MARLSSLLENFVHVKTPMVLKRFEVGKSQYWRANGTFPPCLGGCAIKNCFGIISGLPIAFNCVDGSFIESNSYGYTTIYISFLADFLVNWPRRLSKSKIASARMSKGLLIGFNCARRIWTDQKLIWIYGDIKFIFKRIICLF